MIEIFTWLSTFWFLFGAYLYSSRKASNPKRRMYGFICYTIGGLVYIATCLILGLYPYALTQIVFCGFDLRGIINCIREIKRGSPFKIGLSLPEDYYGSDKYNEEC